MEEARTERDSRSRSQVSGRLTSQKTEKQETEATLGSLYLSDKIKSKDIIQNII